MNALAPASAAASAARCAWAADAFTMPRSMASAARPRNRNIEIATIARVAPRSLSHNRCCISAPFGLPERLLERAVPAPGLRLPGGKRRRGIRRLNQLRRHQHQKLGPPLTSILGAEELSQNGQIAENRDL